MSISSGCSIFIYFFVCIGGNISHGEEGLTESKHGESLWGRRGFSCCFCLSNTTYYGAEPVGRVVTAAH